ncbi:MULTISPECIES: alpha/beta fold hydrolase [Anaerostipes]|uniref:alpha/beta fold hydrolase n=1 Tax=Anaerostipes TaxID=207244 RepID=UPI000952B11A|nr:MULTISPECIES: alpha/beta fold hydrolase [Anaerostipes]MCI5623215.1 hypothetical protein [Anaerostipes sp.]MDY2725977.1 hypothetical protein [Anaerostipes faecalis]OLR59539.1 hypothetical protein BHF70_07875 [Anaerostipes sp. 494a]
MKKYNKLKNITLLGSLAVAGIYAINRTITFICSLKDALPSTNEHTYKWRFGNIFYTKHGKGSPILLIHHLNSGSSAMEYYKLIEPLSKHHTVYALDLLGCGRSEKPKITYTSYIYVQLINDFIKDIIQSKTDIIASGKSVSLVIQACNMEKDNFHKLLFINPENMAVSKYFPNKRKQILKYLLECPIIGTFTYNLIQSMPMVEKRFYTKYFQSPANIKRYYIDAYYQAAHLSGSNAKYLYASLKSDYLNSNLITSLKNINQSMYIAISSNLPDAQNTLDQYQILNPSIESSFLNNTKHLPSLEDPESVYNICRIFF